jgi:hypothetical protein
MVTCSIFSRYYEVYQMSKDVTFFVALFCYETSNTTHFIFSLFTVLDFVYSGYYILAFHYLTDK